MKNAVSATQVSDFKKNWCNENQVIIQLIRSRASQYFVPPILDVGSGLGDIAYYAFPEKEAICIDVNKLSSKLYPLSNMHTRIQIDFFDYVPEKQINTVFICHTLQFIDEEVDRLNKKISEINPKHVILVINSNSDFMGDIIEWTRTNVTYSNPEIRIENFPQNFSLLDKIAFTANIECKTFEKLAKQVGYLMLAELRNKTSSLIGFLKKHLGPKPKFSFNQYLEVYAKNERQS